MKSIKLGIALLLLASAIVSAGLFSLALAWMVPEKDLSDQAFVELLDKNVAVLLRLFEMSDQVRHLFQIAPDFTRLQESAKSTDPDIQRGFSVERWDEYRKLFTQVGAKVGIQRYRDGDQRATLIGFSAHGMLGRGWMKGLAYSTQSLQPTAVSLDAALDQKRAKSGTLFKPIKNHWWIFLDW